MQYSNLYPELQARREHAAAARQDKKLNRIAGLLVLVFIIGVVMCVHFGISLSDAN